MPIRSIAKMLPALVILLFALPGHICNDDCPTDLIVRPKDPFVYLGITSQVCCKSCNRPFPEEPNIKCNGIQVDTSAPTKVDNNTFCMNVTVGNLIRNCLCSVDGIKPAIEFFEFDAPLPSKLSFNCITNGIKEINCMIENLPKFECPRCVNTSIKYMKIEKLDNTSLGYTEKSEQCDSYNSCTLKLNDEILHGSNSALNLNLSIEMQYDPKKRRESDRMTSTSDWIMFDINLNVKVLPPSALVSDLKGRNITITWQCQNSTRFNKDVIITYTTKNRWKISKHLEVEELSTDQCKHPMEVTLQDLKPFTMYEICLSTLPKYSSLWSDPFCMQTKTAPDVPETSPVRLPGAFTVIGSDSFIVYWKSLQEIEWNSPEDGRKYIFQEYDEETGWTDKLNLTWKDVHADVSGVKAGAYFGVVAANYVGRAKNTTVINIPWEKERILGPSKIDVIRDTSNDSIDITWESTNVGTATVFWCELGPQRYSCLDLHYSQQRTNSKDHSFSIAIDISTKSMKSMYGVSLSKRDGDVTLHSGIVWQTCILVKNGASISRQGICESKETITNEEIPGWAIGVIVLAVIIFVTCPVGFFVYKVRSRWRINQKKSLFPFGKFTKMDGRNGIHQEDSDNSITDHDGYEYFPQISVSTVNNVSDPISISDTVTYDNQRESIKFYDSSGVSCDPIEYDSAVVVTPSVGMESCDDVDDNSEDERMDGSESLNEGMGNSDRDEENDTDCSNYHQLRDEVEKSNDGIKLVLHSADGQNSCQGDLSDSDHYLNGGVVLKSNDGIQIHLSDDQVEVDGNERRDGGFTVGEMHDQKRVDESLVTDGREYDTVENGEGTDKNENSGEGDVSDFNDLNRQTYVVMTPMKETTVPQLKTTLNEYCSKPISSYAVMSSKDQEIEEERGKERVVDKA